MKLVIVESPAKCKKIQSYLGDGYIVKASFGHFREIKGGLRGLHPETYMPRYSLSSTKKRYIDDLQQFVNRASQVFLATDDDREGEAIAWHICDYFGLPTSSTPRLIFHEITKPAIQHAIKNTTTLDMDKVKAQFARQVLDLLIGFTVSPVLSKAIPSSMRTTTLSAGRCQTPTLRLVYDRQRETDETPPTQTYSITGTFFKKNLRFSLVALQSSTQTELDEYLSVSENIINFLTNTKTHKHKFMREDAKEKTHAPPQPFTTSTFQQSANNICHISPARAMQIAQKLYEAGYITYMRTDSKQYSKQFIGEAHEYIGVTYGDEYKGAVKPQKTSKNAQEAHEAIRPTKITRLPQEIEDIHQRKVYAMIWKNTLASCMTSAKGQEIKCTITAPLTTPPSHYQYREEQLTFLGWKIVYEETLDNPIYEYLMKMKSKGIVKYGNIEANPTLKNIKQQYTEANLVKKLEHHGIGRPSTFSYLIDRIQQREYVERGNIEGSVIETTKYVLVQGEDEIQQHQEQVQHKEKNKLLIKPIGKTVVEFLMKEDNQLRSLFEYEYTAHLEEQLDRVAQGNVEWTAVVRECDTLLKNALPSSKTNAEKIAKTTILKSYETIEAYEEEQKRKRKEANAPIGVWNGKSLYLKEGRYGRYVQIGKAKDAKKVSLASLASLDTLTYEDVIGVLNAPPAMPKGVLRAYTKEITLREGKYGEYIMVKKAHMTKPKFINCKKYTGDLHNDNVEDVLEWVETQLSNMK